MPEPRAIAGLRQIAADFQAVMVDQFGVMHNGRATYPGAVEALLHLTGAGKTVIVLTNSGKRAAMNTERVRRRGFPAASFSGLVSSGEVAWAGIRNGSFGAPFLKGARTGLVGKHGDDYGFGDLGLDVVEDFGQAEILLIMGSDCPRTNLDDYRRQLAPAAAHSVPALCCNPDLKMLTSHGLQPSAGAIAKLYAELGGSVTFVGKPHRAIYREAARLAKADGPNVLAIGDSLHHDIMGGAQAGFQTALVRTGLLAGHSDTALAAALGSAACQPDFILPGLIW